ncbi:MAG: 4-hydroxy-tetrahydrodipicolinate reductase [Bacteriovoracaceae bacterium]
MKIAVLGKGKTGKKVIEQLGFEHEHTIFDSVNPPTLESLKGHDVVISFLPGEPFLSYIDILVDSKIPVVTGSTGFDWPSEIDKRLKENKTPWVRAHNFSLGMNLVHEMIRVMSKADKLFSAPRFKIHEVHHIMKVDAPSGTALSWQEWSEHECKITSARTGDVVGDHKLTIETETEDIIVQHQAKDRGIFAAGALWSADKIIKKEVPAGLNEFSALAIKELL